MYARTLFMRALREVERITTRKQVAERAGVSEATVSRVLNNVGPVKESTRRKVLQAAKELGYVPNAIAQRFARRKSGSIGVVLPFVPKVRMFSTFYFSEILSGIGEEIVRKGLDLLLLFKPADGEMDYTMPFRTGKIDALIILGSRNRPGELRELIKLQQSGYPFCLVNQRFPGYSFNGIDADHVRGSREAVQHLIEQGYKRIAFLNGPVEYSNSLDRLEGYRQALEEAGLPLVSDLIFEGNYSRTSGYRAASDVAAKISDIDAIFAANDRMAIGLIQGLHERGIRAGVDIAVVGYDNIDAAVVCEPPLTTVHVPFHEMGKRAAEWMISQMTSGAEVHFYEKLETELIVRRSSIKEGGVTSQ